LRTAGESRRPLLPPAARQTRAASRRERTSLRHISFSGSRRCRVSAEPDRPRIETDACRFGVGIPPGIRCSMKLGDARPVARCRTRAAARRERNGKRDGMAFNVEVAVAVCVGGPKPTCRYLSQWSSFPDTRPLAQILSRTVSHKPGSRELTSPEGRIQQSRTGYEVYGTTFPRSGATS
jgi:hypothetical protein